jgi:beta-barrel assembly-enhancing protease
VERSFEAWHFDGETAVRRNVDVQIIGNNLVLYETDRRGDPVSFHDLYFVGHQNQSAVYGINARDGWRLGLIGNVPADLSALLPRQQKYGGFIDRIGLVPSMLVLAGISAACIAVATYTPQWLAPLIPASVERQLGASMVGDFGGQFCHTPKGDAALAKMVRSLEREPGDLKINVANIDVLNAVALPGGNVVLFNGLVAQAKSPDAVAGVLAHEIGHTREHHVMEGMLRQLGMAVVLSGTSGNAGGMLNDVLSLSYGRDAETEADTHSIKSLANANISPIATADFFDRLSRETGEKDMKGNAEKIAVYMSSHPMSKLRKQAFENSVVKAKKYAPVLTPTEWVDLKTMCAQDRTVKSGFGFDAK